MLEKKARWRVAFSFLCLLVTFSVSANTVTAVNNPNLTATLNVVNAWLGGYQGEVVIQNSSNASISGWQLVLGTPAQIQNIWSASVDIYVDSIYLIIPAPWTLTVPANGKVSFGYTANGPLAFTQAALIDPNQPVGDSNGGQGGSSDPAMPTITVTTPGQYNGFGPSLDPIFNYGEALQMGWYFYEAQRSGPLPKADGDLPFSDPRTGQPLHNGYLANRIPWRGDSDLDDGADVGIDLTGGWHDAGDHVKFGLPMAFSATYLAWGVIEFEDALRAVGQLGRAKDNLRWVADYLIRAHVSPNELYGQVGEGHVDHSIWGAPEVMPHVRPAWKIDMENPGPDLAAQTAAAMTTMSLVFRNDEPVYAEVLLQRAKELYNFAQATRDDSVEHLGRYSDSILDAQSFYASRAGAKDDLPFAAAWLYIATGEAQYLQDAEADYTRIADRQGHKGWTMVWDDVRYGVYVLMSKIYSMPSYSQDSLITSAERHDGYFDYNLHAQNFFNHWLSDNGVSRTPGGMAWLAPWGSARYNTSTAFLAMLYRKHLVEQGVAPALQENYLKFATEQTNYVLGDNPLGMSYMVGFGDNYSQVAHHRAAHSSTINSIYNPVLPRHILFGGLAGGPASDDSYTNSRSAYTLTEVATDMNAGLNGLLASLVDAYGANGNMPDQSFPPASEPLDEIYIKATLKTQQPSDLASEVQVTVINESAYPPRDSDTLKFRYFVDLSELYALGFTEADLVLETYWDEGAGVTLRRWQDSAYVFYVEGSFIGTNITPLGNEKKQKNIHFIIRLPWVERGWDPSNDASYQGLIANTSVKTDKIALYETSLPEGEQLIWGVEPPVGTRLSDLPTDPGNTGGGGGNITTFEVTVNVYNDWGSGHCAEFAITNTGNIQAQPTGFSFYLPETVTVTNIWNGEIAHNAGTADVTLSASIDVIPPGESRTQFGYCGAGAGLPGMTPPDGGNGSVSPPPEPVASFSVALDIYDQWSTGFCTRVVVTNESAVAAVPPLINLYLAESVVVTTSWNGSFTRSNGIMEIQLPSWLGEMQPGQSSSDFGFCGNGSSTPSVDVPQ